MKKLNSLNSPISIGGMVMRGEPIHNGHVSLIFEAMKNHEMVYIYLGSRNQPISFENPFSVKQRIEMLKIIFGTSSKLKIIPLKDIGATSKEQWMSYIAKETYSQNLEQPTDYYAGDKENSIWISDVINPISQKKFNVHIIDRLKTTIMSGTRIRKNIANGTDDWKQHVPTVLHDYIEKNFPEEFYQIIK